MKSNEKRNYFYINTDIPKQDYKNKNKNLVEKNTQEKGKNYQITFFPQRVKLREEGRGELSEREILSLGIDFR